MNGEVAREIENLICEPQEMVVDRSLGVEPSLTEHFEIQAAVVRLQACHAIEHCR